MTFTKVLPFLAVPLPQIDAHGDLRHHVHDIQCAGPHAARNEEHEAPRHNRGGRGAIQDEEQNSRRRHVVRITLVLGSSSRRIVTKILSMAARFDSFRLMDKDMYLKPNVQIKKNSSYILLEKIDCLAYFV